MTTTLMIMIVMIMTLMMRGEPFSPSRRIQQVNPTYFVQVSTELSFSIKQIPSSSPHNAPTSLSASSPWPSTWPIS